MCTGITFCFFLTSKLQKIVFSVRNDVKLLETLVVIPQEVGPDECHEVHSILYGLRSLAVILTAFGFLMIIH